MADALPTPADRPREAIAASLGAGCASATLPRVEGVQSVRELVRALARQAAGEMWAQAIDPTQKDPR